MIRNGANYRGSLTFTLYIESESEIATQNSRNNMTTIKGYGRYTYVSVHEKEQ